MLHLFQERLRVLRSWDLTDPDVRTSFPFVGHTYLVRFDAWTYAKENLWASLMHRILFDLNRQLELEDLLDEELRSQKKGAGTRGEGTLRMAMEGHERPWKGMEGVPSCGRTGWWRRWGSPP